MEAQLAAHPGGVDAAAVGQEGDLLGREVGDPGRAQGRAERADGEAGQRQGRAAQAAQGLREHQHPVAGDVEGAGDLVGHGVLEDGEEVVLVQQLQPRVVAGDRGHHGQAQVGGQRALDVGTHHVGAAQQGDPHVAAATGEAAHVGLDLGDVLGVAGARGAARLHLLGEHRGVARAGAVDGGRRLHDEVAHAGRALAGRQQLHRPDDVELLHRAPTPGAAGGGDDAHVDDGVDVLLGDHLGDHRGANVGPHEGDLADVAAGRHDVDADHPRDGGVGGEGARETAPEVT